MIEKKGHNKKWKEAQIAKIKAIFDKYNTVAIANVESLPGAVERKYRELLKKDGAYVINVKNNIIKKFFEESKIDLKDKVQGTSVLILSNREPFDLYRMIKKNAGQSAAKVGSVVDVPIEIPEGDTGVPAGPALSDFKALKLDTQIRNGKIYIAKPKVVVEPGQKVDEKVATVLNKLGIKPIKVFMKVMGVYSKSESLLYLPEALDIDYDAYKAKFTKAYRDSLSLGMSIHYISKDTIDKLIAKAYREAKAVSERVGLEQGLEQKEEEKVE